MQFESQYFLFSADRNARAISYAIADMKLDRGNMEATNVFGAGNPSVPIIDAVTSDSCGCTATCTRRAIAAATASDLESYPMRAAQRLEREPVWTAAGLRGREASHRSVPRTGRQGMPVEVGFRSVAASAPNAHRPNIARSSQWIESGPAINRRSRNLLVTRSSSHPCWRSDAPSAAAAGAALIERSHKQRHVVLSADHRIRLPLRNR